MREARQVNLSKPGKEEQGKLKAEHTRPISVFSTWWRTWLSAWITTTSVAKWRETFLVDYVVGGTGSKGAEEVLADLCDAFVWLGYIATLDYSLCYDYIDPSVTIQIMERLGWPRGLLAILEDVWKNQKR